MFCLFRIHKYTKGLGETHERFQRGNNISRDWLLAGVLSGINFSMLTAQASLFFSIHTMSFARQIPDTPEGLRNYMSEAYDYACQFVGTIVAEVQQFHLMFDETPSAVDGAFSVMLSCDPREKPILLKTEIMSMNANNLVVSNFVQNASDDWRLGRY